MSDYSPVEKRYFPYRYLNVTLILIGINVVVFILTSFRSQFSYIIYGALALIPESVKQNGTFWQVFTYMFVHADMGHIFFNMFALFIFGMRVEQRLGSYEFLAYYLTTGIAAGIVGLFMPIPGLVGASGAIFGVLLAFATLFPNAQILVMFLIPVPAPILVLIYGGFELFYMITGSGGNIAHFAHLAGLAFGFLYFLLRLGINPIKVFTQRRY
jgi:membrane associated rhomboid family serine protease